MKKLLSCLCVMVLLCSSAGALADAKEAPEAETLLLQYAGAAVGLSAEQMALVTVKRPTDAVAAEQSFVFECPEGAAYDGLRAMSALLGSDNSIEFRTGARQTAPTSSQPALVTVNEKEELAAFSEALQKAFPGLLSMPARLGVVRSNDLLGPANEATSWVITYVIDQDAESPLAGAVAEVYWSLFLHEITDLHLLPQT